MSGPIDEADETSHNSPMSCRHLYARRYRTIYLDGLIADTTPSGENFALTFYTDRFPIPERVDFQLEGSDYKAVPAQVETQFDRELEFSCIVSPETLVQMRDQLIEIAKRFIELDDNESLDTES